MRRSRYALLFLLLAGCAAQHGKTTNDHASSSGVLLLDEDEVRHLAQLSAATEIDARYHRLGRAEAKELFWRRDLVEEQFFARLPPERQALDAQAAGRMKEAIVTAYESDHCGLCTLFVSNTLEWSRSDSNAAFSPAALIRSDARHLSFYVEASRGLERCEPADSKNFTRTVRKIERFLSENDFVTAEEIRSIETKAASASSAPCDAPMRSFYAKLAEQQAARMVDDIAFYNKQAVAP